MKSEEYNWIWGNIDAKSNEKEICIMQIMPYISGLGGFSLDKEKN